MTRVADRKRMLARGVLLLCIGILWSCGGSRNCPTQAAKNPRDVLNNLRGSRSNIQGLRAEARVEQRDKKHRLRGTVFMFLKRPSSVRFDAMTQLGPVAILTSDGERFALSDLKESKFLSGPACAQNIARLLGIALEPSAVLHMLLGGVPYLQSNSSSAQCKHGKHRITLQHAEGFQQTIDFESTNSQEASLRMRASQVLSPEGEVIWKAVFDKYKKLSLPAPTPDHHPAGQQTVSSKVQGVQFPFRIRIEQPELGLETVVRYKSVTLNPEVPEKAFAQQPRAGLLNEEVSCK